LRYNLTETRLEKIRRAIVGDPSLTLNGSPMISGYVADVGQLPPCLEALSTQTSMCGPGVDDDINPPTHGPLVFDDVNGNGTVETGEEVFLVFGWNGPYVPSFNGLLQDGWGNSGTAFATSVGVPDVEAGWIVRPAATSFNVASAGRDRVSDADGGRTDIFDLDQTMEPIQTGDFQVALAGWTVSVEVTNATATEPLGICIGLLGASQTNEDQWVVSPNSGSVVNISVGATTNVEFTASATETTSIGKKVLLVFSPDSGSSCALADNSVDFPATVYDRQSIVIAPRSLLADRSISVVASP
ncbi:MAG: hypothetical protein AAGC79_06655, partial [Pseudomonadota bacterium]